MAIMNYFNTDDWEWKDIRVDTGGSRVIKIRGIKWGKKVDKEYEYAEGSKVRAIKHGNEEPRAEMKILIGALCDMNESAIAQGAEDITGVSFPIVISVRAKGQRKQRMWTLVGAEVSEFDYELLQGEKSKEVTLPIMFLDQKPVGGQL